MNITQSLTERAKEIKTAYRVKATYAQEEVDLAVAWARDEVTLSQVAKLVGSFSSVYCFLAVRLRQYMESLEPKGDKQ